MSNVARVRVELRQKDGSSAMGREHDFKVMFTKFKKACADAKVMQTYKEHETYESKSRKLRRKKREAEVALLKNKLRENFIQSKGIKPYNQERNWYE